MTTPDRYLYIIRGVNPKQLLAAAEALQTAILDVKSKAPCSKVMFNNQVLSVLEDAKQTKQLKAITPAILPVLYMYQICNTFRCLVGGYAHVIVTGPYPTYASLSPFFTLGKSFEVPIKVFDAKGTPPTWDGLFNGEATFLQHCYDTWEAVPGEENIEDLLPAEQSLTNSEKVKSTNVAFVDAFGSQANITPAASNGFLTYSEYAAQQDMFNDGLAPALTAAPLKAAVPTKVKIPIGHPHKSTPLTPQQVEDVYDFILGDGLHEKGKLPVKDPAKSTDTAPPKPMPKVPDPKEWDDLPALTFEGDEE